MTHSTIPTKPGIFFAKTPGHKWFNFIVEIYGNAPYLRYRAWDRKNDRIVNGNDPDQFVFGPEIEEPEG